MELNELNQYITSLDDCDKNMIDRRVAEKGIEGYLTQQLIYLDCSRIYSNGMRAMQTIGYPYQREISSYLYALKKYYEDRDCPLDINEQEEYQHCIDKLLKRHTDNLEYEKENPPIWYGGKKAKAKWDKEHKEKLPRRKKISEGIIPGMGKELSNAERLKRLSAQFGNLTFKLKPVNKDE